jgi:hypothetical protein
MLSKQPDASVSMNRGDRHEPKVTYVLEPYLGVHLTAFGKAPKGRSRRQGKKGKPIFHSRVTEGL